MVTPKVFICYKSLDAPWCENLGRRLRDSGVDAWLDRWEIEPGDAILARIGDGLEQSNYLLLILTPESVDPAARWVAAEWQSFLAQQLSGKNTRLVPILLRTCSIPAPLTNLSYLDFRDESAFEGRFQELLGLLTGVEKRRPLGKPDYPAASSYLRSAEQVSEEILCPFLVAEAVSCSEAVRKFGWTFGEMRRLLDLARQLSRRARALLQKARTKMSPPIWTELDSLLSGSLDRYLSEADYAVPTPEEDSASRMDTQYFRNAYYRVLYDWQSLRKLISADPALEQGLAELSVDPLRWELLGFPSEADYVEWRSPTTKTIARSAGPMELELLRRLVEFGRVHTPSLRREGFTKTVVAETFNRLARDEWASMQGDYIELSEVGRTLLAETLRQMEHGQS